MPIRRPNNNDPDWMARRQDEELKSLEKRISALYDEANTELTDEFNRFYTDYQLEYERRLAMVESGEITEDRFQTWCRNHILQSNRYQATLIMLTDVLVNADVAAMALVNNQLPLTLAESYDFVSSLGFEAADRAGISIGTFQIYNADSVQAIIRDNPDLLPVVDLPEDELWNRNHINNEIAQAIIRGDTMPNIARRLQNVTQMDDNAAIRNARTAMTAAENLGRTESASRLRSRGIPIEEVWSATHDARTRDTHLLLDGTKRDEKTGKFGVGIITVPLRFPADPEGEGKEIYNCRCRLNVQLEGIDHTRDDEIYENFMRENYPNDWAAIESQRADQKSAEYRREQERISALERQQRLREEMIQPEENQENPSDKIADVGDEISSLQARAERIGNMTNDEIYSQFVPQDSYVYTDAEYIELTNQRTDAWTQERELDRERNALLEDLKNEETRKPRDQWTDEDELMSLLGQKPMTYTERGEEIRRRLDEITEIERTLPSTSNLTDRIDAIERRYTIEEINRWNETPHPFTMGNIDGDYIGFSTRMGISNFDDDLENGIGFLAEMSPREYLERCAYDIFGSSFERAMYVEFENVQQYAQMMADGVQFDMGYLDYDIHGSGQFGQEGRHRAMAAYLLGIEKIPVYIRGRRK